MFFRNGKKQDKKNSELLPGEFWLLPGDFRMDEAIPGMAGFYGLPGGWGGLTPLPEQEKALEPFHQIVLHTVEQVISELPVALTISDHTKHTCTLWEEQFPALRRMAMDQSQFSQESTTHGGEQFLFVFDRLPKELHERLYQCINIELRYEDIYLDCSALKRGASLCFDAVSTLKKAALLNLHVDWDHLVLIIQAAPDYPAEKLKAALTDACRLEGWTLSDHTKKDGSTSNHV